MTVDQAELLREAAATGFPAEALEKAMRLLGLLQALRSHPFLKRRLVLKGGTALNLFVFDLPRLSVDVDLNYVGAGERDTMVAERPGVEQAIQAVCGRLGLQVRRRPSEHAGGKWRLTYDSAQGHPGTLELDVNFLLCCARRSGPLSWRRHARLGAAVPPRFPCSTSTSSRLASSLRCSTAIPGETCSTLATCWARAGSTRSACASHSSSTAV